MNWSKDDFSNHIYNSIKQNEKNIKVSYEETKSKIAYFIVDDLLPEEIALKLHNAFPNFNEMVSKKSIREDKYVGVQMNKYNLLIEDCVYAFHDKKIVTLISEICQLNAVYADSELYAGGISLMKKNQYLQPHLDNSHDRDRNRWRVLNLLYYVTPDWKIENGGNLELWPNGINKQQIIVESKFNRLVVMATHNESLHSVSPVVAEVNRKCISNYYFSDFPIKQTDYFHVTSFRGRPEQKITDLVLRADAFLRMSIRKLFKKGIVENPHYYKKE